MIDCYSFIYSKFHVHLCGKVSSQFVGKKLLRITAQRSSAIRGMLCTGEFPRERDSIIPIALRPSATQSSFRTEVYRCISADDGALPVESDGLQSYSLSWHGGVQSTLLPTEKIPTQDCGNPQVAWSQGG